MSTSITIDVRKVEDLAKRLGSIGQERIGRGALAAVNEVTIEFKEKAIRGEIANINLTDAYVRGKTDMKLASTAVRPRAEIVTAGDLTVLGRFPGTVWYRQPGAQRRAGPVKGRRSAGVYANITDTDRINEPQWFLMRLKNQTSLMGAFVRSDKIAPKNDRGPGLGDAGRRRDGKSGKRHIYGPSPYQLFRKQIDVQGPQLMDDLEATAVRKILGEVEEVL